MPDTSPLIDSQDRQIVRELARRVAEIAAGPIMAARRDLWRRHNALERVRPVIYVDPQGAWCELIPEDTLHCQGHLPVGLQQETDSNNVSLTEDWTTNEAHKKEASHEQIKSGRVLIVV